MESIFETTDKRYEDKANSSLEFYEFFVGKVSVERWISTTCLPPLSKSWSVAKTEIPCSK